MESEPKETGTGRRAAGFLPIPRTLGYFVILVTILAFIAGKLRNELVLILLGTIFLVILAYCFLGILLMGLLYRKKAKSLSMAIVPDTVGAGKEAELLIKSSSGDPPGKNYFLRLPAILVRCEFRIETKDGRVIRHNADPGIENESVFPVKDRGAYFGKSERLVIFDAPGFFRLGQGGHFEIRAAQFEGACDLQVFGLQEQFAVTGDIRGRDQVRFTGRLF